ncbi:hypothetical protein DFH09DRAFT_1069170 [Mycena vulgaris]|nr:hypothetical protein DFH09DRAFT_1069170 [Mycena vulgaris]
MELPSARSRHIFINYVATSTGRYTRERDEGGGKSVNSGTRRKWVKRRRTQKGMTLVKSSMTRGEITGKPANRQFGNLANRQRPVQCRRHRAPITNAKCGSLVTPNKRRVIPIRGKPRNLKQSQKNVSNTWLAGIPHINASACMWEGTIKPPSSPTLDYCMDLHGSNRAGGVKKILGYGVATKVDGNRPQTGCAVTAASGEKTWKDAGKVAAIKR